jgi:hypothetical protein
LLPIQESFHEDVSEHSALSKRSLQQRTSHLTRTRTGSAGTEQIPCMDSGVKQWRSWFPSFSASLWPGVIA